MSGLVLAALSAPLPLSAPMPLPADQIAPPLDRTIRITTTERRDDGHGLRRFVLVRTVGFAAEPDGFRATLTLIRVSADTEEGERRMFLDANAGLRHGPVVIHLDRSGAVRSIDDEAAAWQAWLAGIAGIRSNPAGARNAATWQRLLAALPPERRKAMIASPLTALFALPEERSAGATRVVRFNGGFANHGAVLSGTATSIDEGGAIRTVINATGPAEDNGAAVSLTVTKRVDATSGLMISSTQRTITTVPGAGTLTREIATVVN